MKQLQRLGVNAVLAEWGVRRRIGEEEVGQEEVGQEEMSQEEIGEDEA